MLYLEIHLGRSLSFREGILLGHAPSIAILSGSKRKESIAKLEESNPVLWRQYQLERRGYDARNEFCRGSGRFPLTTFGKLNSYSLFAEASLQLLSPRGHAGLIVQTNIATDDSNKTFFAEIVTKKRLVSLYDFENKEGVFPGVHRSTKFCLLTLNGVGQPKLQSEFAFFLHEQDNSVEENADSHFPPMISHSLTQHSDLSDLPHKAGYGNCPQIVPPRRRIMEESSGNNPEENPWGVSFMQMINMTSHSHLFRTREELDEEGWLLRGNVFVRDGERYLPLYEAKLFHQYDHRFATFEGVSAEDVRRECQADAQ